MDEDDDEVLAQLAATGSNVVLKVGAALYCFHFVTQDLSWFF